MHAQTLCHIVFHILNIIEVVLYCRYSSVTWYFCIFIHYCFGEIHPWWWCSNVWIPQCNHILFCWWTRGLPLLCQGFGAGTSITPWCTQDAGRRVVRGAFWCPLQRCAWVPVPWDAERFYCWESCPVALPFCELNREPRGTWGQSDCFGGGQPEGKAWAVCNRWAQSCRCLGDHGVWRPRSS